MKKKLEQHNISVARGTWFWCHHRLWEFRLAHCASQHATSLLCLTSMTKGKQISEDLCWAIIHMLLVFPMETVLQITGVREWQVHQIPQMYEETGKPYVEATKKTGRHSHLSSEEVGVWILHFLSLFIHHWLHNWVHSQLHRRLLQYVSQWTVWWPWRSAWYEKLPLKYLEVLEEKWIYDEKCVYYSTNALTCSLICLDS